MAAPDIQLPMNATDQRGSAHFQEISHKYFLGMTELLWQRYAQIASEREALGPKEQLTAYAQPGYRYAERKDA